LGGAARSRGEREGRRRKRNESEKEGEVDDHARDSSLAAHP